MYLKNIFVLLFLSITKVYRLKLLYKFCLISIKKEYDNLFLMNIRKNKVRSANRHKLTTPKYFNCVKGEPWGGNEPEAHRPGNALMMASSMMASSMKAGSMSLVNKRTLKCSMGSTCLHVERSNEMRGWNRSSRIRDQGWFAMLERCLFYGNKSPIWQFLISRVMEVQLGSTLKLQML